MNQTERLKKIIEVKYSSVRAFARECGIAHGTIVSALNNGIDGMAYSKVKQICDCLHIDMHDFEPLEMGLECVMDDSNRIQTYYNRINSLQGGYEQLYRNHPIGIQTFRHIIERNCVYVDKTEYVYNMAQSGKSYFLSRPRRFGKSLMLSTVESYFSGEGELFRGLKLYELEHSNAIFYNREPFMKHEVIKFDFVIGNYSTYDRFCATMNYKLKEYEDKYGINRAVNLDDFAERFAGIIKTAATLTERGVVILIDEYDKPILDNVSNVELSDMIRRELKNMFGVLKGQDTYIRFVLITGVTRFDKISIFSDVNNLCDITDSREYGGICGVTNNELIEVFELDIKALAKQEEITYEECLDKLKTLYDGYRFGITSEHVYNPYSLLNSFASKQFGHYWFATGTPSSLVEMLNDTDFDISQLDGDIEIDADELEGYRYDVTNPIPIMYQAGYLTVIQYDSKYRTYTLGFPNDEVRYGFMKCLLPVYTGIRADNRILSIKQFCSELEKGCVEELMRRIQAIFASAPKQTSQREYELNCQAFIWLIFKLMGQFVQCEVVNGNGRSDVVVWVERYIYLFEFKIDSSAVEALEQINSKDYAVSYYNDNRTIIKVGVNYSSVKKNITDYVYKID